MRGRRSRARVVVTLCEQRAGHAACSCQACHALRQTVSADREARFLARLEEEASMSHYEELTAKYRAARAKREERRAAEEAARQAAEEARAA